MVLIIILSACGTLTIDAEPAASQIGSAATATPISQPTPTPGEATATTTQIVQSTPIRGEATTTTSQIIRPTSMLTIVVTDGVPTETATLELVVEATVGSLVLVHHSDEETGISFHCPVGWTVEEATNTYLFHNGTLTLRINYRKDDETVDLWNRTGIPAGEVVVLDGLVPFLGQTLTINGLVYENRLKMVFYGGPPVSVVKTETMEFTITLDDSTGRYLSLNISDDVLTDANLILSSLTVTELDE